MELLNDIEVRVLGALIEKEITTPDYYPLSLNALINACNQKSSREPVMNLDDDSVRGALSSLQEKGLAGPAGGVDSRVAKFEHRLEKFNFSRREIAVLCVLLLRGSQTPGELRGRTERMYHFEDLEQVQSALQQLMQREPQLVKLLPRRPGTKETRYAHLLSGDIEIQESAPVPPSVATLREGERISRVEEELAALRKEIADLRNQFASFRGQFE